MVCRAMEDAFEDILQRYGEKQEEIYGSIEKELKEVHQVVHLVHAVPTALSALPSSGLQNWGMNQPN